MPLPIICLLPGLLPVGSNSEGGLPKVPSKPNYFLVFVYAKSAKKIENLASLEKNRQYRKWMQPMCAKMLSSVRKKIEQNQSREKSLNLKTLLLPWLPSQKESVPGPVIKLFRNLFPLVEHCGTMWNIDTKAGGQFNRKIKEAARRPIQRQGVHKSTLQQHV